MPETAPTAQSTRPDPSSPSPGSVMDLRAALHRRGLRCTPQRLAVVRLLTTSRTPDHHLTAAQIRSQLADTGTALDPSTVYRTLAVLVEIGTLHATAHPGGATSYGLAATAHHHAVCRRCGRLDDIPLDCLSVALDRAARATSYRLARDSLLLPGTCPACLAADPTGESPSPVTSGPPPVHLRP